MYLCNLLELHVCVQYTHYTRNKKYVLPIYLLHIYEQYYGTAHQFRHDKIVKSSVVSKIAQ